MNHDSFVCRLNPREQQQQRRTGQREQMTDCELNKLDDKDRLIYSAEKGNRIHPQLY